MPPATRRAPQASSNGKGKPARRRAVVASGRRVDLGNPKSVSTMIVREGWQSEAIEYCRGIGDIGMAYWIFSNLVSRARLFVAVEPDVGDAPVAADSIVVEEDGTEHPAMDPALAEATREVLRRLDQGSEGGISGLLSSLAWNVGVTGDSHVLGEEARAETIDPVTHNVIPARDETWKVRSVLEVRREGGQTQALNDMGQWTTLNPDDYFSARIWQPDPFDSRRSWSPMRGVLEPADDYMILTRALRAAATNRAVLDGFLLVDEDLSFGPPDPVRDDGDGQQTDDPFLRELMTTLETRIQNEGTAAAAAPPVVRGKSSLFKEGFVYRALNRPFDAVAAAERTVALAHLVRLLPLPPEVVTGFTDTTFSNAAQVDKNVYKQYVEPFLAALMRSLTTGVIRPLLLGADPAPDPAAVRKVLIWFDPADIVRPPDLSDAADKGYDRQLVSGEAWRRLRGLSEGDAPDAEEILEQVGTARGAISPEIALALLNYVAERADRAPIRVEAIPRVAERLNDTTTSPPPAITVASGQRRSRRRPALGQQLAGIDTHLRVRLQVAADRAMRRAMEKAGNRLRNQVRGDQTLTSIAASVPVEQVAAALGPIVAALTEPDILSGAWDDLEGEFDAWTLDAQDAAVARLESALGTVDPVRKAELEQNFSAGRTAAWAAFAAALTLLANDRLFNPAQVAGPGETDLSLSVPVGLVRDAMATAGGATGDTVDLMGGSTGTRAAGVASGVETLGLATEMGATVEGWLWDYGSAPRAPFEPHLALDGLTFTDWTDPALINTGDWPDTDYLAPGDHASCCCSATPIMLTPEEAG